MPESIIRKRRATEREGCDEGQLKGQHPFSAPLIRDRPIRRKRLPLPSDSYSLPPLLRHAAKRRRRSNANAGPVPPQSETQPRWESRGGERRKEKNRREESKDKGQTRARQGRETRATRAGGQSAVGVNWKVVWGNCGRLGVLRRGGERKKKTLETYEMEHTLIIAGKWASRPTLFLLP